ncbi:RCC1 domain-containing protein, partial [Bifidobacterium indicum]|uniref:RCC1 domain-containing protein n=1 Tax=Bifidobacterium indicum TaxID=1691 RepID=UPI0030DB2889
GTDPTPGIVDKPASAPAGFTWTQASAGTFHSMAIGSDGNLYTWGRNQFGQLGRTTNSGTDPTPGPVDKPAGAPAGFTWTQAIAGSSHSMAFGSDGNLYTWGRNDFGQLGRTSNSKPNPTPAVVDEPAGAPTGFTWTQASAGWWHSMAIGSDGNLYTWGSNQYGQLGRDTSTIGTENPNPTPGMVAKPTGAPAGFTWTQATAGDTHSMAVGSDGNLYTWGSNQRGQLGRDTPTIGTENPNPTLGMVAKPTGAPAGFIWTRASTGDQYSMASGSDGNLYTWGSNQCGQLGRTTNTGTENPNPTPGPAGAPAGFTWTQASAGWSHSMAIGSDGNLYTWGNNQYGQLGRDTNSGTTNPNPVPGRADPPGTGPAVPTGVAFGGAAGTAPAGNTDGTWRVTTPAHAASQTDTVITWTRNNTPQADTHLPYTYVTPVFTVNFDPDGGTPAPPDQQVAEGQRASRPADPVKTGHVFDGWFITGTPVAYDFNRPVTGRVDLKAHWSPTPSWTISPGHGSERGGEQVTLTPPAPRDIRFTQTSAGDGYSMAIGSDGNLYTWGSNSYGQLGRTTNTTYPNPTPGLVDKPAGAPAGFTWTQAITGSSHSMAIGSDGNLYTWGSNSYGQLGRTTNTTYPNPTPGLVDKPAGAPTGFTWTQAIAGGFYSMAFGSDGNLYTWGSNSYGRLGRFTNSGTDPTPGPVDKPTGAPTGFTWTQASAGLFHSMAFGSDGNLYTWGSNNHGELGRFTSSNTNPAPGPVDKPAGAPTGFTWTQATAGYSHSMAFGSDGNLYTWGNNMGGQLGRTTNSGTFNPNPTPGPVDKPAGAPTGFTWTQAITGSQHSMAFGSDGNLYTWGNNRYGQLGRNTNTIGTDNPNPTPGMVSKPAGAPTGFTWTQATAGIFHSMAFGSDGNLYTWGWNLYGQLGRTTNTTTNNPTPGPVAFPGPAIPTGVRFGTTPGTAPAANTDDTWRTTTPAHTPGTVTVTIDWTRDGTVQTPDTGNRYEFRTLAVLPLAGGEGILPLLLMGLLAMAATLAGRRHRQDTTTPTSPE